MSTPHQHRDVAEGFGAKAERYERTRPSYPQELITRIVAASPGPDVVDVGCGTGIAARQFVAAGSFGGHNRLPPETLAELLAGIAAAVDDEFTMGYAAIAVMAVRP